MADEINDELVVSPNRPWGDPAKINKDVESHPSTLRKVLLWFPNRVLDFLDIFRIDVGFGPAIGGVARITKWGQVGLRNMEPGSLRIGLLGRRPPFMLETSNEFGIGPSYVKSKQRKVCAGELGFGLDIIAVGGYVGICPDEAVDFLGGIFTFDFKDDDLS